MIEISVMKELSKIWKTLNILNLKFQEVCEDWILEKIELTH